MRPVRLSNTAWKVLIAAAALFAATLLISKIYFEVQAYASDTRGSLGYGFHWGNERRGTNVITRLDEGSPLVQLGARVGDTVVLDRIDDDRSIFLAGEPVGLTLVHDGVARHAVVKAVAIPLNATLKFDKIAGNLVRGLSILFALLIAFKQPGETVYRALAMSFVLNAFDRPFLFPNGTLRSISDFMYWASFIPSTYLVTAFAVRYLQSPPSGLRSKIARAMPLMLALTVAVECYNLWWMTGHAAPFSYLLDMIVLTPLTGLLLLALFDNWRSSSGLVRQRCAWLLVAIGGANFFSVLTGLPIYWTIADIRVTTILSDVSALLMQIGIAYAVLRHRVFNFGFAINRAVFYSATSVIVLVTFGIVEWLSEHFLHFEAREANVLIDGAIALGVYLAFHKIRHAFEHGLEKLFFHKWHQNEAGLRQFVRKAAHITSTNALVEGLDTELRRFSGGATCAIYWQDGQGDYALSGGTDTAAVRQLGKDDDISVSLRAQHAPVLVDATHPSHAHKLALPMLHRGSLHGYVLLGGKPGGNDYRPDEIAALGFASHQIGLDLHALKAEGLLVALDVQARQAELDSVKIQEQEKTIERIHQLLAATIGAQAQHAAENRR